MNSNIQHTLQSIETAVKALQNKLENAHKEKSNMLNEIAALKLKNESLTVEIADLKKEEILLLESLEASKQLIETASKNPNIDKDAQIDELVREIEYCIEQLTK